MHRERALRHELGQAGASAFLLKSIASKDIISALRTVIDSDAISHTHASPRVDDDFGALSPREAMVLLLTTTALTNEQIAVELGIAHGTVKRHLSNIYAKLGADTRIDAINKARLLGYLD